MLTIFPRKYSFETSLAPKKLLRKLQGDLVEYRPTMNILSTGRFMKKHKLENVYYGRHDGNSFELYFHRIKKRDGGSTGFYGKIIKTDKGSIVKGWFRKPVYAYFFAACFALLCLMCAVGAYAAEVVTGAYVFLGLGFAGFLIMLCDSNETYLRAYLDELKGSGKEQKSDPDR